MPVHDWTRVKAGIFHHFHQAWITHLSEALNAGVLPTGFYALGEQVTSRGGPDVLTLQTQPEPQNGHSNGYVGGGGAIAVATQAPQVERAFNLEAELYKSRRTILTIRHSSSDDRVIAVIEIASPGNKDSESALRSFVEKAVDLLVGGVHLLVVDLHPPGPRDPFGIHGAIWGELGGKPEEAALKKPLQLAAYVSAPGWPAYLQSVAVGDLLSPMPLFLTLEYYVLAPLEATYQLAYAGVPQRFKNVLEELP